MNWGWGLTGSSGPYIMCTEKHGGGLCVQKKTAVRMKLIETNVNPCSCCNYRSRLLNATEHKLRQHVHWAIIWDHHIEKYWMLELLFTFIAKIVVNYQFIKLDIGWGNFREVPYKWNSSHICDSNLQPRSHRLLFPTFLYHCVILLPYCVLLESLTQWIVGANGDNRPL